MGSKLKESIWLVKEICDSYAKEDTIPKDLDVKWENIILQTCWFLERCTNHNLLH